MGLYERNYYQEDSGLDLRPSWDQRSAVTVLIFANVAVFLANLIFGNPTLDSQGVINDALMLRTSDLPRPWLWRHALTYAFVHDSRMIGHILFNMLSLYFLGRPVEQRYGRREFYRIFLAAALFGGILWMLRHALFGGNEAAVMGASGAVLCISMLFVFNFPNATVYLFVFPMPAWVLGIFFVLSNFFLQSGGQVAYDVHLFGIAFAALYFFLGWNFSFLETPLASARQAWRRWMRPRLKVHSEASMTREAQDAAEADRILEKIHRSGKESLSGREKKFLERYSRTVRDKKQREP